MKSFAKSKWILVILFFLGAGVVWQVYSPGLGSGRSSHRGRFGVVKRGDLVSRVTISGMIEPARRTVFLAPYSGYIQKIFVEIGQKVPRGAPVISIATSLQSPETVYPIRAPFSGTVVAINKKEGEYVSDKDSKDIIARIDDLERFFVVAKAPETDAARIKKEMEVDIKVNAIKQGSLKGVVRNIELAAEDADGWRSQQSTFKVQVEILDPPPDIRSGQSAIIDIVTERFTDVLYLGHEFVNRDGNQHFVIDARGRRRDIKIGNQSDMAVEITEGLREGERVEQVDFLKLLESGT